MFTLKVRKLNFTIKVKISLNIGCTWLTKIAVYLKLNFRLPLRAISV